MTTWGGRFREPPTAALRALSDSLRFDLRLAPQDLRGSIAHAQMLGERGIIPAEDARRIVAGLRELQAELQAGRFAPQGDEDVHSAVERLLTERIGPAGGRLHTGRSRNDQVALDLRLYLLEAERALAGALCALIETLLDRADAAGEAILPAYTHLQAAQPVLLAHHLLAYVAMFERDLSRLADARRRTAVCPLGSGACAGSGFPLDRQAVARALDLSGITENSMDAVSDRDFVVEFQAAAALIMVHLSRLAEDIIIWASPLARYATLSDRTSTGSSMMPQKKNPDGCELTRGKTGRVIGHLAALLTTLKGLPLTYHKDLQEDKEGCFDTHDTLRLCLEVMRETVADLTLHPEAMRAACARGWLTATDLADRLSARGLPFREAHERVGRLVLLAQERGCDLSELPTAAAQALVSELREGDLAALTLEASVAAKDLPGGTAPARVRAALAQARGRLLEERRRLGLVAPLQRR